MPVIATGNTTPAAAGRSEVRISSATAVAARPSTNSSERAFGPSRSLAQPASRTEMAPTPGKIADSAAEWLML